MKSKFVLHLSLLSSLLSFFLSFLSLEDLLLWSLSSLWSSLLFYLLGLLERECLSADLFFYLRFYYFFSRYSLCFCSNYYFVNLERPAPWPNLLGLQVNTVRPKIIKFKITFFIVNYDSSFINFSVIGFFISSNKILFVIKFDKSISSWFVILVFNNTYLFNDTIFLEKMKNNLPRTQTSTFFMLFYSLILPLKEFFLGLNQFYCLRKDSITQFRLWFFFS